MAQVNAGRVRFVSRGEYNNSTQYYLFDLVDYNGSSYFAKANTTGNVPTNTTYWQLVAEKGNTGGDGPVGPTGNGIASIIKTASAGLIDTYTITFTDGTTTTFNITNGQDGDVTQEYVDEENERLKSLYNVLPKVSDSGESVELENTGDTMLYKMDLKGNTSQEVVQGEVGLEVEDTSIYVDDVNESKENYITLKGNTYQGGVPTPDAPQEIEVVTGNNTINVTGKNLFDKDNANVFNSYWNSNTLFSNNDAKAIYISCKPNTTYTISKIANNTFRIATTNVIPANNVSTLSSTANHTATSITITTENNANYLWVNYYNKHNGDTGSYEDIMNSIQIEEGSTATTYEAYKGQTYEVNLGSIELCKIGTYQDRIYKSNGNWYKNSQISKVTLNGTEKWSYTSETFLIGSITNYKSVGENICISSHFISQKNVSSTSELLDKHIAFRNDSTKRLYIKDSDITSASDFTTWLSNNNVTLYYILQTPTDTQITDTTLVNQLNALYNATIYSTTHINTETSNLLPYIDLKYNVVTASPSPEKASEVEVVKGDNTITISNEDGTKTQSYNINLGSLELCKIGDYQDYFYKENGNWYKYGAIGKYVYNNDLSNNGETDNRLDFLTPTLNVGANIPNYTLFAYCNLLTYYSNNTGINGTTGSNKIRISISKDYASTHDNARGIFLNKNLTIYYQLATPTTTQITDQLLVSQLDELQKAMSYYDKTIITQTNADKPFILDVIGIRDLQDIFNI